MTKARQRERQKRRQAEAQKTVQRGGNTGEGVSWSEAVRIADAVLRTLAEKAAAQSGLSAEDELEDAWCLFELGRLRLVARDDGEHLGVELCGSSAEQRAQAGKNRRLVEWRCQMALAAAAEPSTVP